MSGGGTDGRASSFVHVFAQELGRATAPGERHAPAALERTLLRVQDRLRSGALSFDGGPAPHLADWRARLVGALTVAEREGDAWAFAEALTAAGALTSDSDPAVEVWHRLSGGERAEAPDHVSGLAMGALISVAEGRAHRFVVDVLGPTLEVGQDARAALADEVAQHARELLRSLGFTRWAEDPTSHAAVVQDIVDRLRSAKPAPGVAVLDEPIRAALESRTSTGLLEFDVALAKHLATLGGTGEQAAEAVLENAAKRMRLLDRQQLSFDYHEAQPTPAAVWRLWVEPSRSPLHAPWLSMLVEVVWRDVVQPRCDRRQRVFPATVISLAERQARLASRNRRLVEAGDRLYLAADEDEPPLVEFPYAALTAVDARLAELLAERAAQVLGSNALFPITRFLQCVAAEAYIRGDADFRCVRIDGGFAELAALAGLIPDGASTKQREKAARRAKDVIYALMYWQWNLPDGSSGSLLSCRHRPAHRGKRAQVAITLTDPWLPLYGNSLKARGNSLTNREARRLVPVLQSVPQLVGRANEYAAMHGLAQLIVVDMRERAGELVTHGGLALDDDWIVSLAERLAVKPRLVRRQITAWLDGEDPESGEPVRPLLKRVGRHRVSLADEESGARAFLEEGGRREIDGRKRSGKRRRKRPRRRRRKKRGGSK